MPPARSPTLTRAGILLTNGATMDTKEIELRKDMEEKGMSYYQYKYTLKEMELIMGVKTRDGRSEESKQAEAYSAIKNIEEFRAAFEIAFDKYYSYIFERDYTFADGNPALDALPILYDHRGE
jgi:hypothetical protein